MPAPSNFLAKASDEFGGAFAADWQHPGGDNQNA